MQWAKIVLRHPIDQFELIRRKDCVVDFFDGKGFEGGFFTVDAPDKPVCFFAAQ